MARAQVEGNVERALEIARESGLVQARRRLLVLVSGGVDSVCLLDVAVRLGASVSALHVNYGLRAEAGADEAHCRELCERLRVPLAVERVELASAAGSGNVQAEARQARYAHAERHAGSADADYATAHTASDQAETVLYRLAVSPGRRALLGMPARRGRLVRPLLEATRDETRAYCEARGLGWREDASNVDPRFARARIRHEVMPVLRELNPAVERTIAETSRLLRDEAEVLDRAVDEAVAGTGDGSASIPELRAMPRGLARLVIRRLADTASGAGPAAAPALSSADVDAILGLGERGGSASLDLGRGLRAIAEYGRLRFTRERDAEAPHAVTLPVPGAARFGRWEVEARPTAGEGGARAAEGDALVDAAALGSAVIVRAWRAGDRMRPAGVGGTKSLQDLFTDLKVPRALRHSLPVVEAGGEIAWVAGVAVAERFQPAERSTRVVSLSARRSG